MKSLSARRAKVTISSWMSKWPTGYCFSLIPLICIKTSFYCNENKRQTIVLSYELSLHRFARLHISFLCLYFSWEGATTAAPFHSCISSTFPLFSSGGSDRDSSMQQLFLFAVFVVGGGGGRERKRTRRRTRTRDACSVCVCVLCVLCAVWSVVTMVTGGGGEEWVEDRR